MDQKSKILIIIFATFIAISIIFTYRKYIIMHDFPVVETVTEEATTLE